MKLELLRRESKKPYIMTVPVLHWCHLPWGEFLDIMADETEFGPLMVAGYNGRMDAGILMQVDDETVPAKWPAFEKIRERLHELGFVFVRIAESGDIYDDLDQYSGNELVKGGQSHD